ncbi:hypothetical protein WN51_03886 [Melipona quadrifasciata]|uniref:Uncharacterized protein n=1 Tax=Melipona quadrifasciata TaxID=166423 RepID=A0A0M8ZPD6_9HYME|nr:hypothetical protein WN51_03886 [Melipona quadrifasciata]
MATKATRPDRPTTNAAADPFKPRHFNFRFLRSPALCVNEGQSFCGFPLETTTQHMGEQMPILTLESPNRVKIEGNTCRQFGQQQDRDFHGIDTALRA